MNDQSKRPVFEEFADDIGVAVSVTECTGFLPRPPQDEEEYDAYRAIYEFAPPLHCEEDV